MRAVQAILCHGTELVGLFSGLQLPDVAATAAVNRAPEQGTNEAAQSQFDSLTRATPVANIAAQTFDWFSATTGIARPREFRVVAGVLQENRPGPDGTAHWVEASRPDPSRAEAGVQHLYLADGHLYRDDGTLIGRFGVNSRAVSTSVAGEHFLRTFGTLHDTSGRLIDYSAATLSLGGQPTVIQLGPPPGMVAILRPTTNSVLVDSNGGTAFREISADQGYERLWVPPSQSGAGAEVNFTLEQVLALPRQADGSRYSPDGRLRFTFNSDRVLLTEARVHVPTNWRDSQGLCMARVSWIVLPRPPVTPIVSPPALPPIPPPVPFTPPSPPPPEPVMETPASPGVVLQRVSPTDAEAFFQLFLTTCRLSDLRSDIGRGLEGFIAPVGSSPRLGEPRTLVEPVRVAAAADAVRREVFDFNLQLSELPRQGMVAMFAALNDLLDGRVAGGGAAAPDGITPVMRVDVTLPPQPFCQQAEQSLAAAHSESSALLSSAIESLQLLQPAIREGLLNELRGFTNRLPPGVQRDQRLWQLELLEIELMRRAGVSPLPQLRPRPLAVS